jgi:hypothetical protein
MTKDAGTHARRDWRLQGTLFILPPNGAHCVGDLSAHGLLICLIVLTL